LRVGFNHSAFALRNEARLQHSPYFSKHIPRGELIELLTKALLYIEVESHWRGDELATSCKNGFSLLDPHACSIEEPQLKPNASDSVMNVTDSNALPNSASASIPSSQPSTGTQQQSKNGHDSKISARNGPAAPDLPIHEQVLQKQKQSHTLLPADGTNAKRKTSPVPGDGSHMGKRPRYMDMDVDTESAGK
jgi:transducin (beta)-like 1